MTNNCKVMEDLFPNYIDDICNEESRQLVEEHLKDCEKCRKKVSNMQEQLNTNTIKSDIEDFSNEEIAKKIVAKIATKKYLTIGVLIFLLLATSAYRFIYEVGSAYFWTYEGAFYGSEYVSQNAKIIHKEKVDGGWFLLFEDGKYFGTAVVTKILGVFWNSSSNRNELLIGKAFEKAETLHYKHNAGTHTRAMVVKTLDTDIQYVVFDTDCSGGLNQYVDIEDIEKQDRYFKVQVNDSGYGYYIHQGIEEFYNVLTMGVITKDGEYIPLPEYRLLRGERND